MNKLQVTESIPISLKASNVLQETLPETELTLSAPEKMKSAYAG